MTLETFEEIYSQPRYTVNDLVNEMIETADLYADAKCHIVKAQNYLEITYYHEKASDMFKRLRWLADKIKEKIANGD